VGKGTVTLDDFETCDTLLLFGQNPPPTTPHAGELRDCARRGATLVSINRCASADWSALPARRPAEMLTCPTKICSVFVRPRAATTRADQGRGQARPGTG
jgi:hypothetical protein